MTVSSGLPPSPTADASLACACRVTNLACRAFNRASCAEAAAAIQRAAARAMGRMELIITRQRPHGLCTENSDGRKTSWQAKAPAPQALQLLRRQGGTDAFVCQPARHRRVSAPRPQDMVVS